MNKLFFLVLLLPCLLTAQTQTLKLRNSSIDDKEFISANIYDYVKLPNGHVKMFFKTKDYWRPGPTGSWRDGLAMIEIGPDFKLVSQKAVRIKEDKTLEMAEKEFPDLPEIVYNYPDKYYEIAYNTETAWKKIIGMKVTEFVMSEGGKKRSDYEENTKEVDFAHSKDNGAKDFWVGSIYSPHGLHHFYDQITGVAFMPQSWMINKKFKSTSKTISMMSFDKDGNRLNMTKMHSDHAIEIPYYKFHTYTDDNGAIRLTGASFFTQDKLRRIKATKKNPNPHNIHIKNFYDFDSLGLLTKHLQFETNQGEFVFFDHFWKSGDSYRFFANTVKKPTSLLFYGSNGDEVKLLKKSTSVEGIFAEAGYDSDLFENYYFYQTDEISLSNGRELVVIDVKGRQRDMREELDFKLVNKGYWFILFKEDGTIEKEYLMQRNLTDETAVKSNLTLVKQSEEELVWIMNDKLMDARPGNYNIEKVTLRLDEKYAKRAPIMMKKYHLKHFEMDGEHYFIGQEKGEEMVSENEKNNNLSLMKVHF